MRYRELGKTGLKVSEIGFGPEWLVGGPYEDVRRIVDRCEELGVNFFDCWMVVTKDRSLAYMTYIQVLAAANQLPTRVRMQGLDSEAEYEINCDYEGSVSAHFGDTSAGAHSVLSQGCFSGQTLMKAGIMVPRVRGDYQALLFEIRKV